MGISGRPATHPPPFPCIYNQWSSNGALLCTQSCKIISSGEQFELSSCVRVRQHCQQVLLKTAHNKLELEELNLTDHLELCIQMRVPFSSHDSSESRSRQNYSLPRQAKVWQHRVEPEFLEQVRGGKESWHTICFFFPTHICISSLFSGVVKYTSCLQKSVCINYHTPTGLLLVCSSTKWHEKKPVTFQFSINYITAKL